MEWTPPAPELVRERLPQIEFLSAAIHQGGFKAVYRAMIAGDAEALKVVKIPPIQNTAEAEAFRREMIGRVRREVEALGKCRSPEIVKLGSIAATDVVIAADDYVVYSEEFIDGKNLAEVIAEHGPKPPEDELRKLFRSLLTAIK